MRIKIYKKNNNWHSKILRSKGGINSLVESRISKSFFKVIKIITFKNLLKAIKYK